MAACCADDDETGAPGRGDGGSGVITGVGAEDTSREMKTGWFSASDGRGGGAVDLRCLAVGGGGGVAARHCDGSALAGRGGAAAADEDEGVVVEACMALAVAKSLNVKEADAAVAPSSGSSRSGSGAVRLRQVSS